MNKYLRLSIILLHCLPNIIMSMRTQPITFNLINAIAEQQKAAEKALKYKNAGLIVPDYIIIKLNQNIRYSYYDYNIRVRNQQSQSS